MYVSIHIYVYLYTRVNPIIVYTYTGKLVTMSSLLGTPQGAASISDGEIELMIHRRIRVDVKWLYPHM